MKGEKIPEGVIKFMEKTPGGKIIDAHAEILPRTSSAETQPISRPNPKQIGIKKEVQKKRTENIDTGKTQPISVKNLREKTNKLSPEEQKKKDALEEALPGLLELTEENKLEKIFPSLFKRIQKIISEEKGELNSQERKYKKSKIRKDRESVIWVQQKKGLLEANPIKYFEEKVRESEEDFNYLSSEDYSGSEEEREKKKDETTRMIVQFKDVIEALEKKLKPKSTDNPSANLPPLEAENVGPVEQTPTPAEDPQAEKARILAELNETIERADKELESIYAELSVIRTRREQRKAKEIAVEKEKVVKNPETQIFSNDFIKSRILDLLESSGMVSRVRQVEVNGQGGEIALQIGVTEKSFDITVDAILENNKGIVSLKNHKIDANWMVKGTAEKKLSPYLDKIPDLLKDYIEKETGKKVARIEIKNGELEVTY